MPLTTAKPLTLYVKTRDDWRKWLQKHHAAKKEIWLIYFKKHTGKPRIPYDDAVEEALCFGWIDSTIKRIDDDKYMQKFTPRTSPNNWSALNIRRLKKLMSDGHMTPAGLAKLGKLVDIDAPSANKPASKPIPMLPKDLRTALVANKEAWKNYQKFAPSYRHRYLSWINAAKRPETRGNRIQKVVELAASNIKATML